ncbi:MAG TPA: aminotransferase class I/II-fold pyridoxal phosphate-dependent enzyme [Myxococcales bacterium]
MTPRIAKRTQGFPVTVFAEFSALAVQHGAVNLGQGFPDYDGPEEVKEAACRAIRDGVNQYAVSSGSERLRKAIALHEERFYGTTIDPATMISVTSGGTEACFDSIMGLVDPGDEVILFEPYYDSYAANIELAGAVPRYVLLRPPDAAHPDTWWFDEGELRAAFNDKTRLIIVNSPQNPTGKLYTRAEMELIAELCQRYDVIALADEVYEHLIFGAQRHVRLSSIPGMAERTVTVASAGKSFGFTGWKIGWIVAPPPLRKAVQQVHQFVTFSTAAPLLEAVATGLGLPDAYFQKLAGDLQAKRDLALAALRQAGLSPMLPYGTYFIMADIRGTGFTDDYEFCRFLTREVGVAAIPPSAFYGEEHKAHGRSMARFAFCKKDSTLKEAAARLAKLPEALRTRR